MYPLIWRGLETDKPIGFSLTIEQAFAFLSESAWVLEDARYKVIIPAWWTPQGRQRAKIRIKASSKKSAPTSTKKGYFQLENIIQYQYELTIGEQAITPQEWQQLVDGKTPLVKFRGQWMELDRVKMQQMLEFWQKNQEEKPEITLLELMKKASEASEEIEVEPDESLAAMMAKLNDPSQLEIIDNPAQLQGSLREYQKRGVSWIQYLENWGLNGCLADDMGLGKTVQLIASLVKEREASKQVLPTLLIAPTSVVGNWHKEIEKFAPHLKVIVHQKREKMITEFQDPETEPSAFVLSLKAGGVGITLTKANHVFHFDRWWNPAVEDQATDRAFRIGQKKNIFVHKFVTLGTLEERIDQMIEDKKKMASMIIGADESWLTELDNESFKQLIALNKQMVL